MKQSKVKRHQNRLIISATRLPVALSRVNKKWEAEPSPGGLATALRAVSEGREFAWFGWPGTEVPEGEKKKVSKLLEEHGSIPVYLTKEDAEGFYGEFSNRVLWPLFHGLVDMSQFDDEAYAAYRRVNEQFAQDIAACVRPGDVIWIHDYQLALVPELLRRLGVDNQIGFFLHIPFPSSELYRTLPVREEILRGILGADLIGFHAYEYVSHFRKACLRVLGIESDPESLRAPGRQVNLAVMPIGIDPTEIVKMLGDRPAIDEFETIRQAHPGKKIIIGVDRLDYTKGIPDKIRAYGELLERFPRWREEAVFIQIAAPSRQSVEEYQALKREVDELVGRINGEYGSSKNTPIVYINQTVSRERLAGMYRAADVALITPIRDGMNLVALEYIAARGDLGGSLILSEFAGAAYLLSGARLVSPYNKRHLSQVLNEALSAEQTDDFSHMLEFIYKNTSLAWAENFLNHLDQTLVRSRTNSQKFDIEKPAHSSLCKAKKPLVVLDYDGTLRSYERKPDAATPSDRTREMLRQLSQKAQVYIVSGRPADFLDKWLGDLGLGMVCEHGFAVRHPGEEWENRISAVIPALKRIEPLFEDFCGRTPGSLVERKKSSIAWHYRSADPEYGAFQANELLALLEDTLRRRPFQVLRGNRVIEVRHVNATKGRAVEDLMKKYSTSDHIFCAGDDRTDEDMMAAIALQHKIPSTRCWVGGRNASAQYWSDNPEQFVEQLEMLARHWGASPKGLKASQALSKRLPKSTKASESLIPAANQQTTKRAKSHVIPMIKSPSLKRRATRRHS